MMVQKIKEVHPGVILMETNALQGTSLQYLYKLIRASEDIDPDYLLLKGNPPLGTCTICIGKKEIGWKHHFGIIQKLDGQTAEYLYRGE